MRLIRSMVVSLINSQSTAVCTMLTLIGQTANWGFCGNHDDCCHAFVNFCSLKLIIVHQSMSLIRYMHGPVVNIQYVPIKTVRTGFPVWTRSTHDTEMIPKMVQKSSLLGFCEVQTGKYNIFTGRGRLALHSNVPSAWV